MEAAILLDTCRERYGIEGGNPNTPDWWITCEYQNVDIWLDGPQDAIAIELKAIHNNKNFYGQLLALRKDLTPAFKYVPERTGSIKRLGIFVASYTQYMQGESRNFEYLRSEKRGPIMPQSEFLTELQNGLSDDDVGYGKSTQLRLIDLQELASLERARYVENGHGSAVWLGLVEPIQ